MADAEYPRWVYPPDGGPGHVVATPDEKPKGWLEYPTTPAAQTGERVIGQPTQFAPPAAPAPAEDEDDAKKSKKK
jgi:hypothetical protein